MRILVTAVGSVSGPFVAQRLTALGHVVIGANVATRHVPLAAEHCAGLHVVAHSSDAAAFLASTLELAATADADCILPLTDPEALLLSGARDRFSAIGVEVVCSRAEALRRVSDKLNLAREAGALGSDTFAVIPTYDCPEAVLGRHSLPMVRKPRVGRSSNGVQVWTRLEQVRLVAEDGVVYQPFIHGPVITVDALRSGSARETVTCCSRLEVVRSSRGLGLAVQVFEDPELTGIVSTLTGFFGITGLVNIEFIRSSGRYFLMDFNLRASAGLRFSHRAEVDFLARLFGGGRTSPAREARAFAWATD